MFPIVQSSSVGYSRIVFFTEGVYSHIVLLTEGVHSHVVLLTEGVLFFRVAGRAQVCRVTSDVKLL